MKDQAEDEEEQVERGDGIEERADIVAHCVFMAGDDVADMEG